MARVRSQHDPLIRRSREEERHRQGVIRIVQPCASNFLCGHADPLDRRLRNLYPLESMQFFLSRGCAHPFTGAAKATRVELLGSARIFQI